ncbi:uncharacterized protein MONOS_17858 [Monocercomonoides exilis]|uniref:uncharacterized protein n=1 Tax=Monocercomonoides exilis TaxID=2049356 RepID=UPI00355A4E0E|nr:hypothetical protein MONOS_17858 [Monocercomonoides exilis]
MPSPSSLSSYSSSSSKANTVTRENTSSEALIVMQSKPEMSFDSTTRFSTECFVSGAVICVFEGNVAVGKHGIFQNKRQ